MREIRVRSTNEEQTLARMAVTVGVVEGVAAVKGGVGCGRALRSTNGKGTWCRDRMS